MASGPSTCDACGSDPVFHRFTYVTVAIDETLRPLFAPGPITRFLMRGFHAFEERFTPLLLLGLVRAGLGKQVTTPDDGTLLLAKVIWEEAEVRGISMVEVRFFDLPRNMFVARLPSGKRVAFEGMPLPPRSMHQAWWLDNKAEMKKRFQKVGIPVPKGGSAMTEAGALRIFRKLTPPLIAKPYSGSASRHTLLHLMNEEDVLHAFRIAKQVAPAVVIEEEFSGAVYRATVVDGVLAATLRRDPPHVIGDGIHSIQELIELANEHPARSGPYFSKIVVTPTARVELSWQGLSLTDIPEAGRRVTLHQKINWSLGGTTADVSDEVHPDNRALFERIAAVLKAPLVGIDFIIGDMSRSWKEQERCGVIECNSMPFFDNHHLPFEGEPRNVAGAIWDMAHPG